MSSSSMLRSLAPGVWLNRRISSRFSSSDTATPFVRWRATGDQCGRTRCRLAWAEGPELRPTLVAGWGWCPCHPRGDDSGRISIVRMKHRCDHRRVCRQCRWPPRRSVMSELSNLVDKIYSEINTQDFSDAGEVFSEDVESEYPGAPAIRGVEDFIAYTRVFFTAFPDARIRADSRVESGDTIVVEGHFTGTHTGPLASPAGELPPTGRQMDLRFADFFQAKDGRIVSHRTYFDQMELLTQLGMAAGGSDR